jgi:hypothetical protein
MFEALGITAYLTSPDLTIAREMPVLGTLDIGGKYIRFQWLEGAYIRGPTAAPAAWQRKPHI